MRTYFFWLKTEFKRAGRKLPHIAWKAVMPLILVGMIAFGAFRTAGGGDGALVEIGYTQSDDALTSLAISYVENMESVKSWCKLVPVSEQEGERRLEDGSLSALLIVPKQVVEGILSGSNERVQLLVSEQMPFGEVFAELSGAAVRLLQTAQAEIYTTHALAMEAELSGQALQSLYDEINHFNLRLAMNREQYFRTRELSVTGNDTVAVYYAGAFFTLFLLAFGLFLGGFAKREGQEILYLDKRRGIGLTAQLLGRTSVLFTVILGFLGVGLLVMTAAPEYFPKPEWTGEGVLGVLIAVLLSALWTQLLFLCVRTVKTGMLLTGVSAVVMGYVSGCFVPSALLPQSFEQASYVLPSHGIRRAFRMLFSGDGDAGAVCGVLLLWCVLTALFSVWRMRCVEVASGAGAVQKGGCRTKHIALKGADRAATKTAGTEPSFGTVFGDGMVWILTKRLLWDKSFWAVLLLSVLAVATALCMSVNSPTALRAAVFAEDEVIRDLLSEYDGLTEFVFCDSEEELKRNVVTGYAQCGYILQEDLQNEITGGSGHWSIAVYESADSTLTSVVNEVVFERVFYAISYDWYEGYIAEGEDFSSLREQLGEEKLRNQVQVHFLESLTDGSTFQIEQERVSNSSGADADAALSESVSYLVPVTVLVSLVLCGVTGVMQVLEDRRKHRFYKRRGVWTAIITLALPILAGMLCSALMIGIYNLFFAGIIG